MWGSQEDGLADSVQNQEQDGGVRRGGREGSLRAPTFSQIPPTLWGDTWVSPIFTDEKAQAHTGL